MFNSISQFPTDTSCCRKNAGKVARVPCVRSVPGLIIFIWLNSFFVTHYLMWEELFCEKRVTSFFLEPIDSQGVQTPSSWNLRAWLTISATGNFLTDIDRAPTYVTTHFRWNEMRGRILIRHSQRRWEYVYRSKYRLLVLQIHLL